MPQPTKNGKSVRPAPAFPLPPTDSSTTAREVLAALQAQAASLQALTEQIEAVVARESSPPPAPEKLPVEAKPHPRDLVESIVKGSGKITTAELIAKTELTKPQVHHYVDMLEQDGIVVVVRSPRNRENNNRRGPDIVFSADAIAI